MAAQEIFADQPSTVVSSGGTTNSDTTFTVASPGLFPQASNSATPPTQFHIVDASPAKQSEIMAVTNVSGSTWTVTRGSEGTTGIAHNAGWTAVQVVTSGWLKTVTTTNSGTPQQFYLNAFGAKGDGKMITDLVLNGTTTATSASAGFTAADTGKAILIAGGAGSNVPLSTTITFVNSTTVTLGMAAGASGSAFPALYGTDDTAAINSAVQAAMAYAGAHPGNYAEITGQPLIYCLAGATTKSTSNSLHYNAQIPLTPTATPSTQKLTLAFNFGEGGKSAPIFTQSVPQAAGGATFACMLAGQTVDGTYGAPSVIGGPTNGGNSSTASQWNNICPVIKGLTVLVPLNPTMIGLDFRACVMASVESYAYLPFDTITNIAAVKPTSSWATGVFMPVELNNDEAFIGQICVYGGYYGVAVYSHTSAQTIKAICCGYGVFVGANGNDQHGVAVGYISAEACGTALTTDATAGIYAPVSIGLLDVESVGSFSGFGSDHIQDPSNGLGGHINVMDNSGSASVLTVSGGGNCEIICAKQPRGNVSAPGIPSSTTALVNPFWRHAWVIVTGGTVTGIAVDGTSTGLTSGAIRVPSGKTVTLTYSAAPSWTWWLD